MISRKPYLVRALHEWICDNGMTPHLLVDCTQAGVQVPSEVVRDGQVVLNVAPMAVHRLSLANDLIAFSARFNGQERLVSFPPRAVLGIYARENGQGVMFTSADEGDDPPPRVPHPPNLPAAPAGARD